MQRFCHFATSIACPGMTLGSSVDSQRVFLIVERRVLVLEMQAQAQAQVSCL